MAIAVEDALGREIFGVGVRLLLDVDL